MNFHRGIRTFGAILFSVIWAIHLSQHLGTTSRPKGFGYLRMQCSSIKYCALQVPCDVIVWLCEVTWYFLAHLLQQIQMINPAYMEHNLSNTSPTAVVGTHNVSVMIMTSTLTVLDLINYRTRNFNIMLISNTLLTHQLLLHLLNQ